jgi:hypothetical protein
MHYAEGGLVISDFDLDKECAEIADASNRQFASTTVTYSTENIFDRVLYGIANGEINYLGVEFLYNGDLLRPNKYGALHNWPKGFCDRGLHYASQRLKLQVERAKKDREG